MATGEITQTSSPLSCLFPIFDNTQLICRGSGSLYLYDLATRSKQDLPNTHADRLYFWPWTLNSRFLVYGHWSNVNGHWVDIYSYDLVTEQELLLALDMPDDGEYYMSSDGRHVVTLIDNRIIDIMSNPVADLTPVGYEDLIYNPISLVWSPVSNLLYIGATDLASDTGPIVNYHFIANVDTGIIQRISISTDIRPTGMLGAYWLPDATRIALSDLPELCILYVDELIGECTDDIQGSGNSVSSIAWSPDSRYIAFSVYGTIYLYDTETQEYSSLIKNIHLSMFFWK
jgi:WD40 repeat protein